VWCRAWSAPRLVGVYPAALQLGSTGLCPGLYVFPDPPLDLRQRHLRLAADGARAGAWRLIAASIDL
jgi:hypothetical protein